MIKNTVHISNPAYLSLQSKQIKIEQKSVGEEDKKTNTLPIEDLGFLILEHPQITITHNLIAFLLAHNVAVITCNEKYMPVGMLLNLEANHTQAQTFRIQIEASEPAKKRIWQQLIGAKIYNQARVLQKLGKPADDMLAWAKNVKSGDSNNLEARAARNYWLMLFMDNEDANTRDRYGPPPNNLLNYAYAILRAITARALSGCGLLPTFGVHHRNKYNAYALADDVMEPYRPYVDEVVLEINDLYETPDELSPEIKRELLLIGNMDVGINNQTSPLMIAVQRTCASVRQMLEDGNKNLALPKM